jgi:glycosyltransferase involved in cell wall biosynthesis
LSGVSTELPAISLVIPSYNQGRYLTACFESILAQRYPNLELIVMDGGSKDESCAIIERYAQHFAHWQSEPDGGQGNAINAGFARAQGTLLTWLNSDDLLLPNALHAAVETWRSHPRTDVVYGHHIDIDAEGAVVDRYFHPPFVTQLAWWTVPYIPQQGTLFTRELWRRVGGIDAKLHCMLDHDLWYRFMQAGARFRQIGIPVGAFRRHSESKGGSWHDTYARERKLMAERYQGEFGSPLLRKLARGAYVAYQASSGHYAKSLAFRILHHGRVGRYNP